MRKQYLHDDNWVEPYYIERYYDITDEYLSKEVGYNIKIIALHLDAFYTNSDNLNIPIMEALSDCVLNARWRAKDCKFSFAEGTATI